MLDKLNQLKEYYKALPWYQKLFFPSALKKCLAGTPASNVEILKAAFDSSWLFGVWFFHPFFYSGLKDFLSTPALKDCKWLAQQQILTPAIVEHNQSKAVAGYIRNIYGLLGSGDLSAQINEFSNFVLNADLDGQNLALQSIAGSFSILNREFLNSAEASAYFKAVMTCANPKDLLDCLKLLQQKNRLTDSNLSILFNTNTNIPSVKRALLILDHNKLFDGEDAAAYLELVLTNQNQGAIAEAFYILSNRNLLEKENIMAVSRHMTPIGVAQCLVQMNSQRLLEGAQGARNKEELYPQQNPQYIADILKKLKGIASPQLIFNSVIRYAPIFCQNASMQLWESAQLSTTRWIEMLMICVEQENNLEQTMMQWIAFMQSIQVGARKTSQERLSGGVVNLAAVLQQANQEKLKQNPEALARILTQLKTVGLLSNDHRIENILNLILEHADLVEVDFIFNMMIGAQLFMGEHAAQNFQLIMQQPDLTLIGQIFHVLFDAKLFQAPNAQRYFERIISFTQLDVLLNIFVEIKTCGLLDNEHASVNVNKILQHSRWATLFSVLKEMRQTYLCEGVDIQSNFDALFQQQHLSEFLKSLQMLEIKHREGIFMPYESQPNFNVLVKHKKPNNALNALVLLKQNGLLIHSEQAQVYRDAITHSDIPLELAEAFVALYEANLLPPNLEGSANVDAVITHIDPRSMATGLIRLHRKNLLYPNLGSNSHRTLLANSRDPNEMVDALSLLHENELLLPHVDASDHCDTLANCQFPLQMADALIELNKKRILQSGLVGQQIRQLLVSTDNLEEMVEIITKLVDDGYFESLLKITFALTGEEAVLATEFIHYSSYAKILCHPDIVDFLTCNQLPNEQKHSLLDLIYGTKPIEECIEFVRKEVCSSIVRGVVEQGLFAPARSEQISPASPSSPRVGLDLAAI